MTNSSTGSALTRETVVAALSALSEELGKHDVIQFPNLRLTMPVPEYLLAMKCMAARLGSTTGEGSDVPDIVFLIRHLGLKSANAVLEIVGQYYPAHRITVKTQYLVEGLFEERAL